MRVSRARVAGVALALSVVLAASACGSSNNSSSGAQSAPSAPAPTGAPINLGFNNIENSPAGNMPEYRQGAQAAVKYINAALGGVNGRPLALDPCTVDGTPATSIACANKFAQSGTTAVLSGIDYGADASVPILANAGIPYFPGVPTTTAEMTSPDAFAFEGASPGAVSGLSRYIGETMKAKKVSILYFDVPAATLAIQSFAKPVLAKLGATDINLVAESANAADYTPAVTKAYQGNPDAILVLFAGQACGKIMQATAALGIDPSKMVYVQSCSDTDQLTAGGSGANAIYNTPYLTPSSSDPDVTTYRNAIGKYESDAPVGAGSQVGFSSVMNVYNQLKKLNPAQTTPAALTAAMRATNNEPSFMGHPYTCDGKQVPGLTAVCDANERVVKYGGSNFTDITGNWVEGVSLLTP